MTENLIVEIEIANDATLEPSNQAQLLRSIADRIEGGYTKGPVIDYNGNKVGHFHVGSPLMRFDGLKATLSEEAIEDLFQERLDGEPFQGHIFELMDVVKESFRADPVDVLGYQGMYFEVPEEYIEQYKVKGEDYLNDYFLTVIEDDAYWDFIITATMLVAEEIVNRLGLNWDELHGEAQGQLSDTIRDLVDGQMKGYLIESLIEQSEDF